MEILLRAVGTAFSVQKIYRKMAATFSTAGSCTKQGSGETQLCDELQIGRVAPLLSWPKAGKLGSELDELEVQMSV